MQIKKYKTKEKEYGYFDNNLGIIYIRDDLKGIDYIDILIHEYIHWLIWKSIDNKDLRNFINCIYDIIFSVIWGWSISTAIEYWREYDATK